MREAIVLLSGGIEEINNIWKSTDFLDIKKDTKAPGSILRVLATAYFYERNKKDFIIVSGGRGRELEEDSGRPDLSEILKRELIELSIPRDVIVEENRSNTTFEQLKFLIEIIKERDIKKVFFISNKYHLPRIKAMIKYLDQLIFYKRVNLNFISAEDILIKIDSQKWKLIILDFYNQDIVKKRVKLEEKGVKDIKLNKYRF